MVELLLEDLSKTYRAGGETTTALSAVSLRVADGEFFTLVGPSGCGKTTTLRLIAGFEAPTAGTVAFGDRDMTGVPPEHRDVGIVFQSYALFPHMTVAENVAYGLRFRDPPGGTTVDERVAELLELVDLTGMGGRDPGQLSGGQQQRVALARALAPGPEVLLLDEPMSALDARLRERLRRQVRAIQSELGITTVYVTHDQAEALAVSDRLAVMNAGRVEQVGRPQDVYRRPATRFVAEFVGENNVFEGTVTAVEAAPEQPADRVAVVDVDGASLRAGIGSEAGAAPAVGAPVVVCVRPEALSVGGASNALVVDVDQTEFRGEAVSVHCRWNGRDLLVRTADVPDADELTVGFDPTDARLLSGADGD